jgi:hypothetical protein
MRLKESYIIPKKSFFERANDEFIDSLSKTDLSIKQLKIIGYYFNIIYTIGIDQGAIIADTRYKRPVNGYDSKGRLVRSLPSVTEGAKTLGVSRRTLQKALEKKYRCRNLHWRYAEKRNKL